MISIVLAVVDVESCGDVFEKARFSEVGGMRGAEDLDVMVGWREGVYNIGTRAGLRVVSSLSRCLAVSRGDADKVRKVSRW